MKIISLLMIVLASSIIYTQDEHVHKEVMPYSSTNVVTNGDINGIIKYVVGKISQLPPVSTVDELRNAYKLLACPSHT